MRYLLALLFFSAYPMEQIRLTKQLFASLEKSKLGKKVSLTELEKLIANGADISAKSGNITPLLTALRVGHLKAARFLLDKGAATAGCLALMAKRGNLEFCTLLLEKGAEVSATDGFKETPLHFAVEKDFDEIAQLLIEHDADVTAQTIFGDTPLHLAARGDNLELIGLLIEKGADVNAVNAKGETPLFEAARAVQIEAALFLLVKKADATLLNKNKEAAADQVPDWNCLRSFKQLLEEYIEEKRLEEILIY